MRISDWSSDVCSSDLKSSRFTDWSRRPLTEKQLRYALADVTHLRPVYEKLRRRLTRSGRESWLAEDMAVLTDPATYTVEPQDAWLRVKPRTRDPLFLALLRAISAWRDTAARQRTTHPGQP